MQQVTDTIASLHELTGPFGILLCVVFYVMLLIFVRWTLIARPVRASLRSQIEEVEVLLDEPPGNDPQGAGKLLVKAKELVNGSVGAGYLFWSQGQELAAWSLVHRAERKIYATLPLARARARPESTVEELRPQSGGGATSPANPSDLPCRRSADRPNGIFWPNVARLTPLLSRI